MKKGIVGVLIVLALVAAGMPFVNGILMEKGFRQLVEESNSRYAQKGDAAQIEIIRYDRGFSSSEIEWKIAMGGLKSFYGLEEIVFLDRAKHGYKGVVSTTSLERNQWFTDFVNEKLAGKNPLEITTDYTLRGQIRSVLTLQQFSLQVEQDRFESQAAELVFTTDWDLEQFKASGTWQGFTVPEQFEMAGLSFKSDLKMISSYIWDGQASGKIEKITAKEDEFALQMDTLQTKYSMKYDEATRAIAVEAFYGVEAISDGESALKNGTVTIGVNGIDAATYEEAMKVYADLAGSLVDDISAAGEDTEQIMAAVERQVGGITLQLIALYEKFLKGGLEIAIKDVRATLPQGEIHGDILLRLEKDLTINQMLPMLATPEQIFEYISLKSDVRLPVELVGDDPMLLSPMYPGMKTGLFVQEGTSLIHTAETRDKKLFINGEQVQFN